MEMPWQVSQDEKWTSRSTVHWHCAIDREKRFEKKRKLLNLYRFWHLCSFRKEKRDSFTLFNFVHKYVPSFSLWIKRYYFENIFIYWSSFRENVNTRIDMKFLFLFILYLLLLIFIIIHSCLYYDEWSFFSAMQLSSFIYVRINN